MEAKSRAIRQTKYRQGPPGVLPERATVRGSSPQAHGPSAPATELLATKLARSASVAATLSGKRRE
ncbi:hypothetical protein COCOBI_05-2700 [Coccomyxa sp. Obi]|nr:hypothetical protein COCOBI_05-2700 [Coccomyxa sp. Obi]